LSIHTTLKISPLAMATIASVLLHGGGMVLVQNMDKAIRLERNLNFSVYRQTQRQPPANAASSREHRAERMDLSERTDGDTAKPVLDVPSESPTPEPLALDQYLASDQVMVQATPMGFVDLNIPEVSTISAPGAMTLKLWINGTGKVVHTEIEKSDFPSAYSDAVAAVFAATTFVPARVDDLPVNSILRIETSYE
jgi:hypothetical protein